jgi:biopolymer transport protein ExbD
MAGSAQQDDDLIVSINITPMVDIVLVLLIIFMVTANMLNEQAIEVVLPEAATGKEAEDTVLGLTIDGRGLWYLNGEPTDEPALRGHIRAEKAKGLELQALIAGDRATAYGEVVRVVDVIKQEGVRKFALNIDPIPLPLPGSGGAPVP